MSDARHTIKTKRNIHKGKITNVGTIIGGKPFGWVFDGECHPDSVGVHYDHNKQEYVYCGYTITELEQVIISQDCELMRFNVRVLVHPIRSGLKSGRAFYSVSAGIDPIMGVLRNICESYGVAESGRHRFLSQEFKDKTTCKVAANNFTAYAVKYIQQVVESYNKYEDQYGMVFVEYEPGRGRPIDRPLYGDYIDLSDRKYRRVSVGKTYINIDNKLILAACERCGSTITTGPPEEYYCKQCKHITKTAITREQFLLLDREGWEP